jgi:hypothetical protein
MRRIKVSEEVWKAIASKGQFGETEDDVLRRVFEVGDEPATKVGSRRRLATNRQSARIENGVLHLGYEEGGSRSWQLPDRTDKEGIKRVRDEAWRFADEHGGTKGQKEGIVHVMADAKYFVSSRTV